MAGEARPSPETVLCCYTHAVPAHLDNCCATLTAPCCQQSSHAEIIARAREMYPTECAEGEHALETPWTFWFDKKLAHNVTDPMDYVQNLISHGEVNSVESFWRCAPPFAGNGCAEAAVSSQCVFAPAATNRPAEGLQLPLHAVQEHAHVGGEQSCSTVPLRCAPLTRSRSCSAIPKEAAG
jgi:hypothetical protein